jgi:hypothetical protein
LRRITLCLPYYLNKSMLERQFRAMEGLPKTLRDQLGMVVVDDGSPSDPAEGRDIGLPLSIYRIDVDIRWNQDAARNIAVHHARTQWLLLTDIDHLVPWETWHALLVTKKLSKEHVYRFSRATLDNDDPPRLSPYKPHPNSWLMTKAMYDHIGGMDERFAGHYGTDSEFRDRINSRVKTAVVMLPEVLWRVPRTTIPDASTTTYTRKGDPIDDGAIAKIKLRRAMEIGWTPKRLSFPYRQIGQWSQ